MRRARARRAYSHRLRFAPSPEGDATRGLAKPVPRWRGQWCIAGAQVVGGM